MRVLQVRIVREDGVLGLFRGGGPTVVRAMALNMGMLASNDQAKEMIEAAGFEKGSSVVVVGGATIAGAASSAQHGLRPPMLPAPCFWLPSRSPVSQRAPFPPLSVQASLRPRAACHLTLSRRACRR